MRLISRRRFCLVTLLMTMALPAAAADGPAKGAARIRYLGGGAIFLDRGGKDGVTVGSSITLKSRRRAIGTCTIDAVADHSARCAFPEVKQQVGRVGDRVSYERTDPIDVPATLPPPVLPEAEAITAARTEVGAATLPKVVYAKSSKRLGVAIANRLDIGVRARGWAVFGATDSAFVRPSVDVGARGGLPFVPGLYASTMARVQGDILAPGNERFRNGVPAEIYVWEAAIGLDAGRGGITGNVGRFRPHKAPGMTVIDGALLGFVGFGGAVEVGAYGGLVPDLITTAPSFDRIAAGAYFGLDAAPLPGVLLLPRARVGFLSSSDFQKTRAEVEAQLQTLWQDLVAVGASVRVALPGETAVPVLDAARINVDVTPSKDLRVRLGWRATGEQVGDLDAGVIADGTFVSTVRASNHGDAMVQWALTDNLIIGGSGALAIDDATGDMRGLVGPEVAFPRLFGAVGGLSLGAYEEPGTTWGRSAFVQSNTRPLTELLPGLTWATRVSYFEHEAAFSGGDKLDGALRETMLMTFVDAPILSWLSVRGRAQSLFDIVDIDGFGAVPVGVFLDVGLTGSL